MFLSVFIIALDLYHLLFGLGIVFEFMALYLVVRRLFRGSHKGLKEGNIKEEAGKRKWEGILEFLIIFLLLIGLALQYSAVYRLFELLAIQEGAPPQFMIVTLATVVYVKKKKA